MEMKETQLVTFYIGKLSAHNQTYLCAHYFEDITDFEERKAALRYAEDSGLNTEDITKQVVENIRNRMHDVGDFSGLLVRNKHFLLFFKPFYGLVLKTHFYLGICKTVYRNCMQRI